LVVLSTFLTYGDELTVVPLGVAKEKAKTPLLADLSNQMPLLASSS
jgi:hypothetical protein